jgi:hypothetical protein
MQYSRNILFLHIRSMTVNPQSMDETPVFRLPRRPRSMPLPQAVVDHLDGLVRAGQSSRSELIAALIADEHRSAGDLATLVEPWPLVPRANRTLRVQDVVSQRLDALVDQLRNVGVGKEATRQHVLAALISDAQQDPGQLAALLYRYKSTTVGDLGPLPSARVTTRRREKPGRRPFLY